jgi:hypothetical protein
MNQNYSLLQNVSASDFRTKPFPHVVVRNALPQDLYERLSQSFPPAETILKGKAPGSNKRFDYLVTDLDARGGVDPLWKDFLVYHASSDFFAEIVRVFGNEIRTRYPVLEATLGPFVSWNTGIRKRDTHAGHPLVMDAHISINTPVIGKPTSVRKVHVDDPRKLYAGLFYMRRPEDDSIGGDLVLYRWARDDYRFDRQHTFEKYVVEIETLPYTPNTFILFLNSIDSLHGVTPRHETRHVRTFVNLVGELEHPLFDLESRQISWLSKKLRALLNPSVYDYR